MEPLLNQGVSAEITVIYGYSVPPLEVKNARQRVQERIHERLDELGMTGRAFAKHFGHKDGWINAIRDGRNALKLDDLDLAAHVLKTTAGDLVRLGDEAWDLRPTEMRLIRALRLLPYSLQDHLMILTEYLVGVTPDEIELVQRIRALPTDERQRLQHGLDLLELTRRGEPKTTGTHDRQGSPTHSIGPNRKHQA